MKRSVKFEVNSSGELIMYNPDGEIICRLISIPSDIKELVKRSVILYGDPSYSTHKTCIHHTKDRYKWFTEKHQITPTNALKVIRGYVSNEITKKYPYWFQLVRSKRFVGLHSNFLELVSHEPDAEQAVKDGIKNIVPFIIALQKTPQELKEHLGKSLWKSLCKNSYTRNLMIARKYIRLSLFAEHHDDEIKFFTMINQYPSTILCKKQPFSLTSSTLYCVKVLKEDFKIPFCKLHTPGHRVRVNEVINVVKDTLYELRQDGKPANLNWSYRRFKEEHDKLMKNRAERYKRQEEARKEKFKLLKTVDIRTLHKKLDMIEFNGVKATPLTSFDAIRQEGDDMHHCVGGYAERCASGDYVVYSLVAVDGTRSTLGISVNNGFGGTYFNIVAVGNGEFINTGKTDKKTYAFSQHYLACNQPVQDKDVLTCATKVVEYLNS